MRQWEGFRRVSSVGAIALLGLLPLCQLAAESPAIPELDRLRLAEFRRLCDTVQDSCWPGWSTAPRAVLLVTGDREYLCWHPTPDSSFSKCGYDPLLGSEVYCRPRVFSPEFQATFPFSGPIPTIVIGTADSTVPGNSAMWVVTVMHEHFHQWQDSRPSYFAAVDSLGLSGGDKTGMWMLNYPFPYDSDMVASMIEGLCRELAQMVQMPDESELRDSLRAYVHKRDELLALLAPSDARYMEFQLWQEGVARYMEERISRFAAEHEPALSLTDRLADWHSYQSVAQEKRTRLVMALGQLRLSHAGRLAFYPIGAGEALVLERLLPDWPGAYRFPPFGLGPLLKRATMM